MKAITQLHIRTILPLSARLLLLAALLAGFGFFAPPAAPATAAALPQLTPLERLRNPDGTLNLNTGFNGALDLTGWKVTLDAQRGPLLCHPNTPIKPPLPGNEALASDPVLTPMPHDGLDARVNALASVGDRVYVGGTFLGTHDGVLQNLNRFTFLDNGAWRQTGNGGGVDGEVFAMAIIGNDVYVGGYFHNTQDGLQQMFYIARYNTISGIWYPLPDTGLDDTVYALAVDGTDLYVGGKFMHTWGANAVYHLGGMAKFDTVHQTWSALPNEGLWNAHVYSLAIDHGILYVGGSFSYTGDGTVGDLNNIARYDLSLHTWSRLPGQGLNGAVKALAVHNGTLYVGGVFTATYDNSPTTKNIATYSPETSWLGLPDGGLNDEVTALTIAGDDVYIGGKFTGSADGVYSNWDYVVKYSGGSFIGLPNHGVGSFVNALLVTGNDLYMGGLFTWSGDSKLKNLNYIAKYAGMAPIAPFSNPSPPDNTENQSTNPTLSWDASAGATHYDYCITTTGQSCDTGWVAVGSSSSAASQGVNATIHVTLHGLSPYTRYYWLARAWNGGYYVPANGGVWWAFTTGAQSQSHFYLPVISR